VSRLCPSIGTPQSNDTTQSGTHHLLVQGFRLSGLLAAVAAGAIGGLPFMGGEDRRTYERYHLKRAPAPSSSAAKE